MMNNAANLDAARLRRGSPVLAFDVGGTDVKSALIAEDGTAVSITRNATPHEATHPGEAVIEHAAGVAAALHERFPSITPRAVGFVVPGIVDEAAGVGVFAENMGWRDFAFRDVAEDALALPVAFGHDVRGAAEAERRLGAARPFRDVLFLSIGTGIAGALFIDGRIHRGGGMAGEVGHARIAEGPECGCGGSGCVETLASATAIVRRYNEGAPAAVRGAREVLERAKAGDGFARAIWADAVDALALGLSHTVSLVAPEAIVIGGGLAQAGQDLFEPLERSLSALLSFQRMPRIIRAKLGQDAGVVGAALIAQDLAARADAPRILDARS